MKKMPSEHVILDSRKSFIIEKGVAAGATIDCDKESLSGAVSQRACVYCGARVVLNPITDAVHIVHGPIGCASYTWDIRGSLSSDSEMYRNSFSTDLREKDIIFGGETKLAKAIEEVYSAYHPKIIFVYATCVVGVIGDDVDAVCKLAEQTYNLRVIPVKSPGFTGNKRTGYKMACMALMQLMGDEPHEEKIPYTINYLGDFNLAAEAWIIQKYLREMGIRVISTITGDASYSTLINAPKASYNVVQCAGSMTYLAKQMKKTYGIPFEKVRFLGVDETVKALRKIAYLVGDTKVIERTNALIEREMKKTHERLETYKKKVAGKKAAIYVGGGFKAIALIKQFRNLGMHVVVVGTQTGDSEEYAMIRRLTEDGTVILDDANPSELQKFAMDKQADLLVGGVKERPLAYKLGMAFIDHNHERKHALSGFEGAVNFAKEVDMTLNSPVWHYVKNKNKTI
nr:nitrogenase iron-molybdenum cofactor biosynthesis protein NifE [Vallitalea pronyensis]